MTDLQGFVYEFVMNDVVRKENFSDIEIHSMDDNLMANKTIWDKVRSLSEQDCVNYLMAEDTDFFSLAGFLSYPLAATH